MNTLKRMLGLVVAVSMIQSQANQPALMPIFIAGSSYCILVGLQALDFEAFRPQTTAGTIILGLTTLVAAKGIWNIKDTIAEKYNQAANYLHDFIALTPGQATWATIMILLAVKAYRENNILSPFYAVKSIFEILFSKQNFEAAIMTGSNLCKA